MDPIPMGMGLQWEYDFFLWDPNMDLRMEIPIWISIWGYPYGDPHVDPHGDSNRNPVGMEIPFPRQH